MAFSIFSAFNLFASGTSRPPYLLHQVYHDTSLSPCFWHSSLTGKLASASLRQPMIYPSLNHIFFMSVSECSIRTVLTFKWL